MVRTRPLWRNRAEAGGALAGSFSDLQGQPDTILVALPRGGVPVAVAMADVLALPVATWAVRKLAHPSSPEFAIGAVAPGGVILWDLDDGGLGLLPDSTRAWLAREQEQELRRRQAVFGDPPGDALRGLPPGGGG
jgi:putative phosphoribosyl transferase